MELVIDVCEDYDNVESKVGNGFVFEWFLRMSFKERNELSMSCRDYCVHLRALTSSHRSTQ